MLALLATPFLIVGVSYYPSDPERWLFLIPPLWLCVGMVWDQYAPGERGIAWNSPILLAAIVIGLGTYNAAALLPDALANRYLTGLRELSKLTGRDDLVISPSNVKSRINEFYLDRPIPAENLTVMALVEEHGADLTGMQADLTDRIDRALRGERRIFVFGLIGEGHEKQKGYPWAHIEHHYGPDTFLAILEKYQYDTIYPTNRRACRNRRPQTEDGFLKASCVSSKRAAPRFVPSPMAFEGTWKRWSSCTWRPLPVDGPHARGPHALPQPPLVAVRFPPGLATGGREVPAGVDRD